MLCTSRQRKHDNIISVDTIPSYFIIAIYEVFNKHSVYTVEFR